MAVRGNPWLVTSWRISHLGMNPVSGGKPPKERRIRQASAVRVGALVQAEARVIVLVEPTLFRVRKAAVVMAM